MGIETISLLILVAMIGLMLTGMPLVYVTMAIAVSCTLYQLGFSGLPLIASRVSGFVTEYVFVSVPLFVLMACVMERSGVARDLYDAMYIFAGRLRGGVAVQTMIVAVFLAAMTGIIGGEVVLLGMLALPQMLRLKYDRRLAMGTICAGGSLGTLIPPSVVLIVYGLTANVSINDLFVAGSLPGVLLASLYLVYIIVRCRINPSLGPIPTESELNISRAQKLRLLKGLVLPFLVILWVLGSIYGGIASVTEAAGVGVAGAFLSAAIRKELNFSLLKSSLMQSMQTVGMLIWLTFGANALIGIYNIMGGTSYMKGLITGLPFEPMVIVLIMMGVLIVMGTFMDWIGICLLTMPIFVPVVVALGYDPVWFGILFTMNMQVSYLTPPFGPACFYLKGVAPPDISLNEIFNAMWPFIGLQIVGLALVLYFPQIAMWLSHALR
ncbi:MAG: TRAP transporter large permease [Gammaproteobacteria bacterium]